MHSLRLFAFVGLLSVGGLSLQAWSDATINFSGTLVNAPNCTINGNNTVDVNFGDEIITRKVDGENYKQPIEYVLDCSSVASNGMKVAIKGTAAPFGNGLIMTDKEGLGIQLYNGTLKINNAAQISFTYPVTPKLYAAPVAQDPLVLAAGGFTGTASLVLNYQ